MFSSQLGGGVAEKTAPSMNFRMYFLILLFWATICHAKKDKIELSGDPTYHRHRTKRSAPTGQMIDPEIQLQQSLPSTPLQAPPAATKVDANPSSLSSSSLSITTDKAVTSSSSSNIMEEQEGIGDSRTRLDSTGEVGIGEFKDGHEKVKTYQMSLLDKVTAAAGDFFASDIDSVDRGAFIEYLKNSIILNEDEIRTLGIAVDAYLEMHDEHKRAIAEGDVASKLQADKGMNKSPATSQIAAQQAQADWAQTQAKAAAVTMPTSKRLRIRL